MDKLTLNKLSIYLPHKVVGVVGENTGVITAVDLSNNGSVVINNETYPVDQCKLQLRNLNQITYQEALVIIDMLIKYNFGVDYTHLFSRFKGVLEINSDNIIERGFKFKQYLVSIVFADKKIQMVWVSDDPNDGIDVTYSGLPLDVYNYLASRHLNILDFMEVGKWPGILC